MCKIEYKKSVLFILSFYAIFAIANNSLAANAEGNGLQVSPLQYDWSVNLGDQKSGKIYVKNDFTYPITVDVDVQDFFIDPTNANTDAKFFVPNENHNLKAYDVINWIKIDKSSFDLNPNDFKEISFETNIPQGTPTGGYYGVIFFHEKANNESEEEGVNLRVENRIGVLMTFGVKGKEAAIEKGELKQLEPVKKVFIDNPINFTAKVKNTGNLPYKISGTLDIYRLGKKIDTIDIASRMLYVDRVRMIDNLVWKSSFTDIGKYEARLHLESEDGLVVVDGSTSFTIIPWRIVSIGLLILIIVWIVFSLGFVKGHKRGSNK
jgi:hypothetical protein